MNKIFAILLSIFLTLNLLGADTTTYYDDGSIHVIYKRYKFRKEFYMNGMLKQKTNHDKVWKKGREVNYDSLGQTTSKGKIIYNGRRHGTWKLYDEGKLQEKIKYKYGIEKNNLYTENGKRVKCYLTYGLGAGRGPCDSAENKFRVRYVPVAGCLVTNKLLFKTTIHNFFVEVPLAIKHGFKWHNKANEMCVKSWF